MWDISNALTDFCETLAIMMQRAKTVIAFWCMLESQIKILKKKPKLIPGLGKITKYFGFFVRNCKTCAKILQAF